MTTDAAFAELVRLLKRAHTLATVDELLGWDEQVNLPSGAAEQRANQHAILAEAQHAAASTPRIGELLDELESGAAALSLDRRAVVTEARRDYDRATRLPSEFVREKAEQNSRGYHAWARAKAANDFASYAPVLEKNLELAHREAGYLGHGDAPYDYMLDRHDPGMTTELVAGLFAELRTDLVPFAQRIAASGRACRARDVRNRLGRFAVPAQRALVREVTARLGFDYARGRVDDSLHPFCSGTGSDVRLTVTYSEDQPLAGLFAAIHETGHGLYEQGLPAADIGTALGQAAGMAVHESQSRLWENQVARSAGFWRWCEPIFREHALIDANSVTREDLGLAVNAVGATPIRVHADEVTYNLHIILRFDLERRLFAGTLAVRDLPAAWSEATQALLGIDPPSDREGVLQDVHWSDGAFGYFPSYCLGNMIAAQLWEAARQEHGNLEEDFARGDFSWLLGWLRRKVHREGRRMNLLSLVRHATGHELSARPLIQYFRQRHDVAEP